MLPLIAVNGTKRIGGGSARAPIRSRAANPAALPRPAMTLGINQYERRTGSLVERFTMLTAAKLSPARSLVEGQIT